MKLSLLVKKKYNKLKFHTDFMIDLDKNSEDSRDSWFWLLLLFTKESITWSNLQSCYSLLISDERSIISVKGFVVIISCFTFEDSSSCSFVCCFNNWVEEILSSQTKSYRSSLEIRSWLFRLSINELSWSICDCCWLACFKHSN